MRMAKLAIFAALALSLGLASARKNVLFFAVDDLRVQLGAAKVCCRQCTWPVSGPRAMPVPTQVDS